MKTLTCLAVGAVTALVAVAPISAASSANAATTQKSVAMHWTVIETGLKSVHAKQEACKVSANRGTAWKIYNRLDSSKATMPLTANMTVTLNHRPTKYTWTSHVVKAGHISAVGTVVVPRKARYGLVATWSASDFGNGGPVNVAKIGLC